MHNLKSGSRSLCAVAALCAAVLLMPAPAALARGSLVLQVRDGDTGQPLRARLVVRSADGREIKLRREAPAGQGVAIEGETELVLPDGAYQFELFRGPEYQLLSGTFELERTSSDTHTTDLDRFVDMRSEGWISGDVAVDHPPSRLPLLMDAADLHIAATIGAADDRQRSELPAAIRTDLWPRDLATGLMIFGGTPPDEPIGRDAPVASLLTAAHQTGSEATVVTDPTAWELPIWLASGRVSAVMVLGPSLQLGAKRRQPSGGRPPALPGYTDPQGPGRWAETVYWQMLETGLHIPPVAGSGGTANGNPVGYNRVYVHLGEAAGANGDGGAAVADGEEEEIDVAAWWDGLWRGRSVVTNGPLLRPRLGGELPGATFRLEPGETVRMPLELRLGVRDPVDYLDVIRNGEVVYSARLDEFAKAGGEIPELEFDASAWVVCRVVTSYPDHYRMAFSAPWYIEVEGEPRISRAAVEFFRDWLEDHVERLRERGPAVQRAAAPYVQAARRFWNERLEAATVP